MADILPRDLQPVPGGTVLPGTVVIIDDGAGVYKATVEQVASAGTPLASSDEVAAGSSVQKYLNPERTVEAINTHSPVRSVNGQTGVVILTKDDIGLGNVENIDLSAATGASNIGTASGQSVQEALDQIEPPPGGDSPTYTSVADGLSASSSGRDFTVDNGDGTVTVYLNDSGTAVEQRTLATVAFLAGPEGSGAIGKGAAKIDSITPITPDQFRLIADPDDTLSIQRAEQYCFDNGKALTFMARKYYYSEDLNFRCEVFGQGVDTSWLVKTAPATVFHNKGAFRGVKIAPEALAVLAGDTTDGFVATSLDRKDIEIRTEYHGGNGFVFESGNLSRAKVYSRRNNGRGIWLPAHTTGDNNCLDLWAECTRNGLSGFEIGVGGDTNMANCVKGYVIAQSNGELVDPASNSDVALAGFEHFLTIYSEYGPVSATLTDRLFSSFVFFQVASFVTMIDNTTDFTNEISYTYGARGSRRTKAKRLENLVIKNENLVGYLRLHQSADRTYKISAEGSGAEQAVELDGNVVLKNASGRNFVTKIVKQGTLTHGSVPAGGMVERSLTFDTPVLVSSVLSAMPRFALPAGIVFDVYALDAAPETAIVRCTNITAASVTVSGAWRVQALSL